MNEKRKDIYSLIPMAEVALEEYKDIPGYSGVYESDFHLINSLITQKAFEEGKNIYIGTNSQNSPQNITLAILMPAAYTLLAKSSMLHMPEVETLKSHYIFIREGISYYYKYNCNNFTLGSKVKGGDRLTHYKDISEVLLTHFVADKKYYSDQKCHKALDRYKEFYQSLTMGSEQPPSFFKKKIVVICNKGEFFSQLNNLNLNHCIPFGSIVASDKECVKETLPIDPIVLVASDYELARTYMLKHMENCEYEYLVVSGDTRISKLKSLVKNDCGNGLFRRYCLIGNQAIQQDNSMLLWHWTRNEESRLLGKCKMEIEMKALAGCDELTNACIEYYGFRKDLRGEYDSLEHFGAAHKLFFSILGDKLNVLEDIDEQLEAARIDITRSMLSDNYEKEDVEQDIIQIINQIYLIYKLKKECPTVWSGFSGLGYERINLVVENDDIEIWRENIEKQGISNILLISHKDFRREIERSRHTEKYYFIHLIKDKLINWLHSQVINREVCITMLLYPPEISILKSRIEKLQRWERQNTGTKDKTLFPELDLHRDDQGYIDDPIGRFEDKFYEVSDDLFASSARYEIYDSYSIRASGDDGNIQNLSCPQKVLRKDDDDISLVSVTDLEAGDTIVLYTNTSRDYLYKILSDESERFAQVEIFSMLWKQKLREYLELTVFEPDDIEAFTKPTYNEERLKTLSLYTGLRSEYLLHNWVSANAKVRFPQKSKLEKLTKFLNEQGFLSSSEVADISSHRDFFTGVMISLGHNLSTEAQAIILNKSTDYDQFIGQYVCDNTEDYPLLSKLDVQAIKSILKHNFIEWKFIQLVEQGEQDEE
ncbi:MAG: hypothetical protein PHT37_07350 [Candidatus Cloacimonetes bacterium]|nr:hypothetical protein [Candidatus Cloacimonadota bacterium]MDD4277685.1 hypothetical protein [Candidatus Cloacimonadota bacterium]